MIGRDDETSVRNIQDVSIPKENETVGAGVCEEGGGGLAVLEP